MRPSHTSNITQRMDTKLSHQQTMIENSPESDKFKKYCNILSKYYNNYSSNDKVISDIELISALSHIKGWSKKTKYQLKILDSQLIQRVLIPMMSLKGNMDNAISTAKIILNVSKNKNNHYKLSPEDKIMKELLNLLIIHLNSNLTSYILKIFFHLTDNKEFLTRLKKLEHNPDDFFTYGAEKEKGSDIRSLRKVDIGGFTRVFTEKILDDLDSTNKILLLKTVSNIYTFDIIYMHPDSIEPIMRCLGNKDQETTIPALKLILMYAKDKSYHQQLIHTNFVFRMVRIYKQGIVEHDVILVQILLIFFGNESLHDLLFENNLIMILENYLQSFDNDQNEELIKNVFEIFKEIIKITDAKVKNPLKEDKKLQVAIFTKALSLASSTKKEKSILSCLSTINMMLNEFSVNLISEESHVKKIIELMPSYFKSKDVEIVKFSLSIFEAILTKKQDYFEENYVKSNDKTFNLKHLIFNVINLINELNGNFEVISKCCSILITLSDLNSLHNFFLQEPQITIIRVFNDDLITEKIKLIKEFEKLCTKKIKDNIKNLNDKTDKMFKSTTSIFPHTSPDRFVLDKPKKQKIDEVIKKEEEQKKELEKKLLDNKEILKASIQIVANLSRYSENLEVLTNKGFLDIINKMLIIHNFDALPQIVKCIQGFCCSSASINIILNYDTMQKILKLFKRYRDNSPIFIDKNTDKSALFLKYIGNSNGKNILVNNQLNEDQLVYEKAAAKLEVLLCLRNIVESDIKLQRQFILDEGVHILLGDVTDRANKISDKSIDQLNSVILKVMYVISCNINKLYIVFNKGDMDIDDLLESDFSESLSNASIEQEVNSQAQQIEKNSEKLNASKSDNDNDKPSESVSNQSNPVKTFFSRRTMAQIFNKSHMTHMDIFRKQLSQSVFMEKLLSIGYFEITSIGTYKDLMKILINLYLNRYYLKYFTTDDVFEKVMAIIEKILTKYVKRSESNYDIIKLILIFLKFICEEENLIKRFLDSSIISNILNIINTNEFAETIEKEELEQFYYNTSLVLLRLTEFKGHTEKFEFIKNMFKILENLYDINFMNGKIYIINIIKNILTEKSDFFEESDIVNFINKIVSQANSFVIYEFVELLKNLVHNRNICKRMENVFKYLINEIKNSTYSHNFKKRILELILCLSYENSNIKDFALHDLLLLIKNLEININQKTTLLILMNFSSVSSNFSYLQSSENVQNNQRKFDLNDRNDSHIQVEKKINNMSIKKKELVHIMDQLLYSDRFSQILIQRLMINITSIDNIDLRIIGNKVVDILIQILNTNKRMQDSIIIFALCIMINITNRNILMSEFNNEEVEEEESENSSLSFPGSEKEDEESVNLLKFQATNKNNSKNSLNSYDSSKIIKNTKPKVIKDNSTKDMHAVDYLLQQFPDIIKIINDLYERNNMDITALTIMFSCNLTRKIKSSPLYIVEKKITNCVESHFIQNCNKNVFENDSGMFYVISIIKYCICLSGDEKKVLEHLEFFTTAINLLIEVPKEESALNETSQISLNTSSKDEGHILDLKEERFIRSNLKRDHIVNKTVEFVLEESKLKFFNIILQIQTKSQLFNFNSDVKILVYNYFKHFVNHLSNLFLSDIYSKITLDENLQQMIFSVFNILIILLKEDYFDFSSNAEDINHLILFLIQNDPSKLNDDLKSIFTYSFYTILNQNLDIKELKSNAELIKWLIKLFKISSNSEQTDYFCLKIFLMTIRNGKVSEIYWKSNKFIKKLHSFLSKPIYDDERLTKMKKEVEKIFNIISLNQHSHKKLNELGIYSYFKAALYLKPSNSKSFTRDDVVFLVNMILNKENSEFIKEDIISLLKKILLCKFLINNVKIKLFENFLNYSLDGSVKFKEDYLQIFNILYENIKENFSDIIILLDNFTKKKKYESFCKMLSTDDKIIIKIYEDFLNFDKNFPSHLEELNCFFKLLEIFTSNNMTINLENLIIDIIGKIMINKNALADINILNSVLGFVLYFFSQNLNNENENSDLSDIDSNYKRVKYSTDIVKSVHKFKIPEFIDTILKCSIQNENIISCYIITTMLCHDEFKSILECLKGSTLFTKDFFMVFIREYKKGETLDIKEFAYIINLALTLNNYYTITNLEELLNCLIDIYEQFFTSSNFNEDVIVSLFFFCDLAKTLDLSKNTFNKFLKFIINFLTSANTADNQKEILIKYYNEVLSRFKITTNDDLNTIFSFFLKIHYDKVLNYIEFLIMGTIITNSTVEVIIKNFDSYLQMIALILTSQIDVNKLEEFLNFMKHLLFNLKQISNKDSSTYYKLMQELKSFYTKNIKNYEVELKSNEKLKENSDKILSKLEIKI